LKTVNFVGRCLLVLSRQQKIVYQGLQGEGVCFK